LEGKPVAYPADFRVERPPECLASGAGKLPLMADFTHQFEVNASLFFGSANFISQSVGFSAVTGTLSHAFRNTFIDRFFHNGWAEALIGFQPQVCDRCGQSFVQNPLSQDLFAPLMVAIKN
jgi:hypothetical protein